MNLQRSAALRLEHRSGREAPRLGLDGSVAEATRWSAEMPNRRRSRLDRTDRIDAAIAQMPLLAHLPDVERRALAQRLRLVTFKKGEVVFSTGDAATCMYWIV